MQIVLLGGTGLSYELDFYNPGGGKDVIYKSEFDRIHRILRTRLRTISILLCIRVIEKPIISSIKLRIRTSSFVIQIKKRTIPNRTN